MDLVRQEEALCVDPVPPIVFLDFDGVLNTAEWLRTNTSNHLHDLLNPKLVRLVDRILEATGAKVVLSTSWRQGYTFPSLAAMLYKQGLRKDSVIGATAIMSHGDRAREIRHWVEKYGVEYFVILDDLTYARIPGHFIQSSIGHGLTESLVEEAIETLKRKYTRQP